MSWRGRLASLTALAMLTACAAILDLPSSATLSDETDSDAAPESGADVTTADAASDGVTAEADPCVGIDLMVSAAHCGRCGHDCGGGACEKGICQPLLLAENQGSPLGLAIDDTFVYWADFAERLVKSVKKVPAVPGTLDVVGAIATDVDDLRAVAADGQYVYFTVEYFDPSGGVHRCPRTGCVGDASTRIAPGDFAYGLVVGNGTMLYAASNESTLKTALVDGGNLVTLPATITQPRFVARDDTFAYCTSKQNTLEAYPLDGGATITIGPQPGVGQHIAADGQRVVWADIEADGGGSVRVYRTGGGSAAETLATGPRPHGVVLDKTHVYFTFMGSSDPAQKTGSLVRCPIDGCLANGPEPLLTNLGQPAALVADDTALYFVTMEDVGSARVWKLAKP